MNRYVKGVLPKTCEPTVAVEYQPKDVKLSNNENVRLNIWDTGNPFKYFYIYSTFNYQIYQNN